MSNRSIKAILIGILGCIGLIVCAAPAQALPTFARQTGMSCAACHTVYPELTTYGRTFKLNGYTTNNSDSLKDGADETGYRLNISNTPPIAAMLQVADVFTHAPQTGGLVAANSDNNGTLEFPSQFSLFYAGAISPKMGAFVQFTYDSGSGSFGMDNTDIRIADRFQVANTDLVLGLTLNNNPTVQDIFNNIPAWGFPYATGKSAITPATASMIESLGGSVGGLGLYAFWNQLLYAEISAYRTAPQGMEAVGAPDIQGYAPYWRVALTKDFETNSFEIGAFGMNANTYPNSGDPTLFTQNNVDDIGVDGQFQFVGKEHQLTVKGSCIWENQKLGYSSPVTVIDPSGPTTTISSVAANATDTFTTAKADITYYYDRKVGATVGYFTNYGSGDTGLYSTASGTPDSAGWVIEVNYVPWYNTKFSLQYTMYDKFNGSVNNYDTVPGRNASDNNTLMAMAWLMY